MQTPDNPHTLGVRPVTWTVKTGDWKRSRWTITCDCERERLDVVIYARSDAEAEQMKSDVKQFINARER